MDFQEREKKLFQILSGKVKIVIRNKRFENLSPTIEILSDSNDIYFNSIDKLKYSGILNKEKIHEILITKRILRNEDFLFIEKAPNNIELLQEELYVNRENASYSEKIRSRLSSLRKDYSNISIEVARYDNYSVEGMASMDKIIYVILKTTYYKNNLIKFNKSLISKIIETINIKNISNSDIRKIARTTPWLNMWSGLKKNGIVFKQGVESSVEQKMLMMWSSFYDSLAESAEPPEEYVIEDDDLLDGWLITQRKNKKKDSKFEKYDEVYLLKKDNETDEQFVNRIESMNTKESKMLKKERVNQVFSSEKPLNHADLADVQRDMGMKFTKMMMKGKK